MVWLCLVAARALVGIIVFKLVHVDTEGNEAHRVRKASALNNLVIGESVLAENSPALAYSEVRACEDCIEVAIAVDRLVRLDDLKGLTPTVHRCLGKRVYIVGHNSVLEIYTHIPRIKCRENLNGSQSARYAYPALLEHLGVFG